MNAMNTVIKGNVHLFGANIDTDAIIPARYANLTEPGDLGRHCMEGTDPDFAGRVSAGDIIVAGSNFGCGSSREVAPISIKGAGIACVLAKTFARIFFRNAINIALPVLECPDAVEGCRPEDELEIDLTAGAIRNLSSGKTYTAAAYPQFLQGIINAGGLIAYAATTKK